MTKHQHNHPKPGTAEYDEHLQGEIEHYGSIFEKGTGRETLVQPVPPTWTEIEARAFAFIRSSTGDDVYGHVVKRLQHRPGVRMLSLGSGPGGVEINFAQMAPLAQIVCIDVNPELLSLGRQRAKEAGLNMTFKEGDLNTIELPQNEFDLVFNHASLHHVIELERLSEQIERTLRPGGELYIVDVITRNGYRMWDETREVVKSLFKTLPSRFRLNHTAYGNVRIDDEIWEADTSEHSMECIRSEDILPVLNRKFSARVYVPYFSISRRFFDTMYGPNYNLENPLDRALLDWIWELDLHYLATARLRPETFFGIFGRKY
jgi:ubiquinone/menaquinone biosynthesis C-methylase UbiE